MNSILDYESLERFQISENYQNLLQSLKLIQHAANLNNQKDFNVPELSNLEDKEMAVLHTIRYMSGDEITQLIETLNRLSRTDQKNMKESFGVWAEKLIESVAQNSIYRDTSMDPDLREFRITPDQMVMAYEGFTAIVSPKSKVSDLQRDMVKKVWDTAAKKAQKNLRYDQSNIKDINSLPIIQEIENHRITGAIDISNPNPSQDQIDLMAQQLTQAWVGKGEGIKGVIAPLITNQDTADLEIIEKVKKTLERQGHLEIAGELNKNIHFAVGTRTDLLSLIKEKGKKEIDPAIEMDPDDVNEVLLSKIQEKIGKSIKINELSLKLFTDNIHRYKKKWESKIQIYMILSNMQVVEISKELSDSLRAREVLALQQ